MKGAIVTLELANFNEAVSDEQWKMAIEEQITMIEKNEIQKLVDNLRIKIKKQI